MLAGRDSFMRGDWTLVPGAPEFSTLKEGVEYLKTCDFGSDGLWKRYLRSPGNPGRRVNFQCNRHVDCPLLMRCAVDAEGGFQISSKGTHATEETTKIRNNSAMTHEQEKVVAQGIKFAAKPGMMLTNMTQAEVAVLEKEGLDVQSIHDKKKTEGGLTGALCIF